MAVVISGQSATGQLLNDDAGWIDEMVASECMSLVDTLICYFLNNIRIDEQQ